MTTMNEEKHASQTRGRVLARGRGVFQMLDRSYKEGWNDDNSILDVKDVNNLDSSWTIYEIKKEN